MTIKDKDEPLPSYMHCKRMLAGLKYVDHVVEARTTDLSSVWERYHFSCLFITQAEQKKSKNFSDLQKLIKIIELKQNR